MKRIVAPLGLTIRRKKVAYCNNNVIPLLKKRKIPWDMNEMRIIFCGKRFFMGTIENGKAEEFINSFILEDGQVKLDMYMRD